MTAPSLFRQSLKPLSALLLIAACIGSITYLQLSKWSQLTTRGEQTITATEAQAQVNQTQANLTLLQKIPALGFNNLIADWAFLSFLQYFGDEPARRQTSYRLSPEFFEIIVNRDPRFTQAYPFLSSSVSLYAGQPQKSVALMAQGLKSLSPETAPQAYYLWRYKATDELLFLGKPQAARQSYLQAAEWARASNDPGSDPVAALSQQTAEFLANNPESKQAQVSAWMMVLSNAPDQPTRELAIQQIQRLGGQISINPQGEVKVDLPPD